MSVTGPMYIYIKECPVLQWLLHAKEPSLLNGHVWAPSIDKKLNYFTANDDAAIWVK